MWSSEPVGTSLFYDAQRVAFESADFALRSSPIATVTREGGAFDLDGEDHTTTFPTFSPTDSLGLPPSSTPVQSNSFEVVVPSRMAFRLFEGIPPRAPTQDEITGPGGLLDQTALFYIKTVGQIHTNLESFVAEFIDMKFDATSPFPITIDFDAVVTFAPGRKPRH